MYSILNDKQLVQAYPKFLAEWYTSQQLAQYALSLSENGMVVYPITSWTYVGLTEKSNYHVFTADLPADYGKFFYDMLFDVIDGIMYPVSRVLPVETELQGPAINRNGLWLNGGIAYSYVDFCEDAAQMQAIDDLLSTLNFSISIWVYTTYSGIDKPILHKSISDLTELMFALYPDKWVSTTKTTSFTRPTAGTWHLYTIDRKSVV